MGRFMLGAALAVGLASPAAATTYTFDQANSAFITPGFVVDATISFTGSTFGFPTVSNFNNPGPYDFAPMTALAISFPSVPNLGPYTLADFTAAATMFPNLGFPAWSIAPAGISFVNRTDTEKFTITGGMGLSEIHFLTDLGGICGGDTACFAFGTWDPIPAPGSLALVISALVGMLGFTRLRPQLTQ